MSKKNYDNHNRWRNKTVAFRVSAEEDLHLEALVKLTGLTKQDYIIRRLLERDVVVQGNPDVYKRQAAPSPIRPRAGNTTACSGRELPRRSTTSPPASAWRGRTLRPSWRTPWTGWA